MALIHSDNKPRFDRAGITARRARGYTGKGVKVAVAEDTAYDHGSSCADVIRQIAPGAEILTRPRPLIQVVNGEITPDTEQRLAGYYRGLASDGVQILSMSLIGNGTRKIERLEKDILLASGITPVVAAGNEDGEPIYPTQSARLDTWIAVGAAGLAADGRVFRLHYSQVGPELDVMGFTGVITSWGVSFSGTSCAAAFVAGLLALWFEEAKKRSGRFPTFDESLVYLRINAEDMGVPGRDDMTGAGLARLGDANPLPEPPKPKPEPPPQEPDREEDEEAVSLPTVNLDVSDRRLTPNFMLHEFTCECCGALSVSQGFKDLVARLQVLRNLAGAAVNVTSGYRCPKHDRAVGTSSSPGFGPHTTGCAADIWIEGLTVDQMAALASRAGFTGIGKYPNQGFVHVDMLGRAFVDERA